MRSYAGRRSHHHLVHAHRHDRAPTAADECVEFGELGSPGPSPQSKFQPCEATSVVHHDDRSQAF